MKFEDIKVGQILFTDKYGPHNLRAFFFVEQKNKLVRGQKHKWPWAIFGNEITEGDAYGEWFKLYASYTEKDWKDSEMRDATLANKKQMFRVIFTDMEHVYEE